MDDNLRHDASAMPAPAPAFLSSPRTYAELRCGVESVLLTGQRRIEEAKVRTIGKRYGCAESIAWKWISRKARPRAEVKTYRNSGSFRCGV